MIKMPAATKLDGEYMGAPNVCLTPAPPGPPVPMVYISKAMLPATDGAVDKVLIANKEVVVEGSKVPNTMGDEAGTNGGVMSGVNMNQAQPKTFSSKVFAAGKKVVAQTAMVGSNGTNANVPVAIHTKKSQDKVLVGL